MFARWIDKDASSSGKGKSERWNIVYLRDGGTYGRHAIEIDVNDNGNDEGDAKMQLM